MTLFCVTNDTPDLRSCTAFGVHTDSCDDGTCTGCQPRTAKVGVLCFGCWNDFQEALSAWTRAQHLYRGVKRAISPEPGSAHAGPRLPLTPLEVDLDRVDRLANLIEYPLERWVATEEGAAAAVRFARAAVFTLGRHPVREEPRNLPRTHCPNCSLLTLREVPPAYAGDARTVRCANCGHTLDQTSYEALAAIEAQCCRRCRGSGCTDPGCRCHRSAPVPEWQRTNKGDYIRYRPDRDPRHVELFDLAVLAAAVRWKTRRPAVLALALKDRTGWSEDRLAESLERLADHPDLKAIKEAA